MSIKRWEPKIGKSAFDILSNPIAAGALDQKEYDNLVAKFLTGESIEFPRKLQSLYKKKRFSAVFNSSARDISEITARPIVSKLSGSRMAEIYKGLISAHHDEIVKSYSLRRSYEIAILRGEYSAANTTLRKFKDEFGESFWWIRANLLLLAQKEDFQGLDKFSNECKDKSKNDFLTLIINFSLLLASDPSLHFKKMVTSTIRELTAAKLSDWAGLLELLFAPRPLITINKELFGFAVLQVFPVIDQVYLLENFFSNAVAQYGKEGDPYKLLPLIRAAKSQAYGNEVADSNKVLADLISLYERDQFNKALELLENRFSNLESPFPALNLVAKILAIDPTQKAPFSNGAWGDLCLSLAQFYKLESPPSKLEDDFLTRAIRFQSFSCSQHLQLSIFKALPKRFTEEHSLLVARAAEISCRGTLLTEHLANGNDPILEHIYTVEPRGLPNHRKTKAAIRELWKSGDFDKSAELLPDYKKEAPLFKDFVELATSLYSAANKEEDLLEFSANVLGDNPQLYVALPIKEIVEYAEREKLSSLAALVVFYIYAKRVDSQKDYLLNEAYDEFLISKRVEKPSELLQKLGQLSSLEVVFFRDISALETMDYLACFNNSTELRSERVRILDALREKRVIAAEIYREELDEIVGQVVVDAGVAEFNINKIEVNTSAIKRDLIGDITSMLLLYQSLDADPRPSERIIQVESDSVEGDRIRAVVTGDRNTSLLRMLVLVRDRFLTDEKHGLGRNLSTEIRHGFFANLMRSRLEENHLITEVDDQGNYKPNEYWRTANAIVNSDLLDALDGDLAWFSDAFNQLIAKAENWMKISRQEGDGRVFDFDVYLDDIDKFHSVATRSDADQFLDAAFENLWVRVNECLLEMREKLNVSLKNEINQLFEQLLSRINETRKSLSLVELNAAIIKVKSEIHEDIATVSEWFKRSESSASFARSLDVLVKTSIECFFRVRSVHLDIDEELDPQLMSILIDGRYAKSFIVILVNLLENSFRGSGHGLLTSVSVIGTIDHNDNWSLSVSNPVSSERLPMYTPEYIANLDSRMRSPVSAPLMHSEGGTGLAKVFNQLRLIDDGFDVKIELIDSTFRVSILYGK